MQLNGLCSQCLRVSFYGKQRARMATHVQPGQEEDRQPAGSALEDLVHSSWGGGHS